MKRCCPVCGDTHISTKETYARCMNNRCKAYRHDQPLDSFLVVLDVPSDQPQPQPATVSHRTYRVIHKEVSSRAEAKQEPKQIIPVAEKVPELVVPAKPKGNEQSQTQSAGYTLAIIGIFLLTLGVSIKIWQMLGGT